MTKQRYRLVITGFQCHTATYDDSLEYDGKGDEVFISIGYKRATRDGTVLESIGPDKTLVMGDTNLQSGRIQVGSARDDKGGLLDGDAFPSKSPWKREIPLDDSRYYPPFKIWEGDLTQGSDAVFITPSIWEWDDGAGIFPSLVQWFVQTDQKFGQKAKEVFGPLAKPYEWIFDAVSLGIQTVGTLTGFWTGLGKPGTRPIGVQRDPANPDGVLFNPKILQLTYDIAEFLLTENPTGHGNGILAINYLDDTFARGDYTLYLQLERVDAAAADGYFNLGGSVSGTPVPVSWGPDRLDVFAVGTDGSVQTVAFDGASWGGLTQLGSNAIAAGPAVVSWGPGRIDLFVRGTDNRLYTKSWNGSAWIGYTGLGDESFVGAPAAVSWGAKRIDVFVQGTDGRLYTKSWNGSSWSGYTLLGAETFVGNPSVVSWGANRIDVFVRGTDDRLYTKFWDGTWWSAYVGLGGETIASPPVPVCWGPDRIDVFVRGTDDRLYTKSWDGTKWSGYTGLGPETFVGTPSVASWGPNRLDVVVQGTDNRAYRKTWNGAVWSGYVVVDDGVVGGPPVIAASRPHRLDVLVVPGDGGLRVKNVAL